MYKERNNGISPASIGFGHCCPTTSQNKDRTNDAAAAIFSKIELNVLDQKMTAD